MLNPGGVSQVEAWQENCPRKGQNLSKSVEDLKRLESGQLMSS